MKGIQAGDYLLHIYPFSPQTFTYSMQVIAQAGSLPPDKYEENDEAGIAAKFYNGCDFTNNLTIDSPGDDDYYYIDGAIGIRLNTDIRFDSSMGDLQLFLDGKQATEKVVSDGVTKLHISQCQQKAKPLIRVSGNTNHYGMCILAQSDSSCLPRILNRSRFLQDLVVDLSELARTAQQKQDTKRKAELPDIGGKWQSNIGLTYQITQDKHDLEWEVPEVRERGSGRLDGNSISATWKGELGSGSATGVVVDTEPSGKTTLIQWNNGVVFFR
jgi:hypothetical protein